MDGGSWINGCLRVVPRCRGRCQQWIPWRGPSCRWRGWVTWGWSCTARRWTCTWCSSMNCTGTSTSNPPTAWASAPRTEPGSGGTALPVPSPEPGPGTAACTPNLRFWQENPSGLWLWRAQNSDLLMRLRACLRSSAFLFSWGFAASHSSFVHSFLFLQISRSWGSGQGKTAHFEGNTHILKASQPTISWWDGGHNIEVSELKCLSFVVFPKCFKSDETSYLVGACGQWKFS